LKKNIEEGIKQEKEIAINKSKEQKYWKRLLAKQKLEIPDCLIEREASGLINNLQNRVRMIINISF
jgi:FKBP-type peptidyl-prolyl cis-trans isomerase (trigger factor)